MDNLTTAIALMGGMGALIGTAVIMALRSSKRRIADLDRQIVELANK